MRYHGICGLDFILSNINSELYIIEANPRFLGSSFLINAALADTKLPSLFYFHHQAFQDNPISTKLCDAAEKLYIPYYSKVVTNRGTYTKDYMNRALKSVNNDTPIFWEGFSPENCPNLG